MLQGLRAGLDHHAVMEQGGWEGWFSMPQNISRGIFDVFSFVKFGKLMWI